MNEILVENELSSITRQCVSGRRFPDIESLQSETAAWSTDVNRLLEKVAWTPRPSENELETDGRGVRPTVFNRLLTPPNAASIGKCRSMMKGVPDTAVGIWVSWHRD